MPRLYSIKDDFPARYNPAHFFPSAYWGKSNWSSSTYCWQYDVDKDFPIQSYAHVDLLTFEDTEFWIALRKDVERRYNGDCFFRYEKRDYRYWWNTDAVQDFNRKHYNVTHGYWTFYFEEASDQTMFVLKHGEMLTPFRYRFHPGYGANCMDERYDVPDDEEIPGAWKIT